MPGGQSTVGSIDLPVPVTCAHSRWAAGSRGRRGRDRGRCDGSGSGEADSLTDFQLRWTFVSLAVRSLHRGCDRSMRTGSRPSCSRAKPPVAWSRASTGLPDVGAIAFDGTVQGPRNALTTHVTLRLVPLHATVGGTLDLVHEAADVMVSAQAPAMQPRPDVSWQSVSLDARVHGPFTRPDATGRVQIDALKVAGGSVSEAITADIAGNAGRVQVDGQIAGLRLPVPNPICSPATPLTFRRTRRWMRRIGRACHAAAQAVRGRCGLRKLGHAAQRRRDDQAG